MHFALSIYLTAVVNGYFSDQDATLGKKKKKKNVAVIKYETVFKSAPERSQSFLAWDLLPKKSNF